MNKKVNYLVSIGISHKTSTISEREKFQIDKKEIHSALQYFKSMSEVGGTIIVSTCNRLEFYFTLTEETDPYSIIYDYYRSRGIKLTTESQKKFYVCDAKKTPAHLFEVITGLDSIVLGEYQIQGQIKDAYSVACSEKTVDKTLHKLFHTAFRTGKEVRTQTQIGSGNQSFSGVAFKAIKEHISCDETITIVGVNQNSRIIGEELCHSGYNNLIFVNRTLKKAVDLAEKYGGIAVGLDKIEDALMVSSCIFSCTGAPGYILTADSVRSVYSRTQKLHLAIDMAVPHDIESDGLPEEIQLVDLDGLQKYLDRQNEVITADIPKAKKIIFDEANLFQAWNKSQHDENIFIIEEKVEAIRLQLLNETKPKLSEKESELLDKFSRSLVHRMKSVINETVRTNSAVNNEKLNKVY